jgi:hypothetical protein
MAGGVKAQFTLTSACDVDAQATIGLLGENARPIAVAVSQGA